MTKLTDMQLVLLSTAAARPDGSLLPPAESLGARADRIRRAVEALIKKGLAGEIAVTDEARSWRFADDVLYGVAINDAGRAAIAVEVSAPPAAETAVVIEPQLTPAPAAVSKIGQVLDMMRRDDGATLTEMVTLTGWLPHTTRAALTGLRKKGHTITKTDRAGSTAYHVRTAA
ncbi:MAG: DUF3489 domain-containing protein [Sphingomonas fennica]